VEAAVNVPELLTVETDLVEDVIVVHVVGEVDMATTPLLNARLNAAMQATPASGVLVVDLLGVQFIGSAGLAVLVEYQARCQAREVTLRVVASGGPVRRVLRISALDLALNVFPSVAEAASRVNSRAEPSSMD
jgi:anti-sigma B factor antagonist